MKKYSKPMNTFDYQWIQENNHILKNALKDYGVKGVIVSCSIGPIVTLFKFDSAPGTRAEKLIELSCDIARLMKVTSIRISIIPGKHTLGIKMPSYKRKTIFFQELIESSEYNNNGYKLPLVLGQSVLGRPIISDLSNMPHLLIAGTTGSGKSVSIHAIILSLLHSKTAKQCRFVMIDPKMLELSRYNGIPHLISPVVIEVKKAVKAFK